MSKQMQPGALAERGQFRREPEALLVSSWGRHKQHRPNTYYTNLTEIDSDE